MIDAHTHLSSNPQDYLRRFSSLNGLRYSTEELLESMERLGIERAVLLSPPLEGGGCVSNSEVLSIASRAGGTLTPVLTAEPDARVVREAIGLADSHQTVRGFKIRLGYVYAYASDPVFEPLYEYAERRGLPVMFHTGDTAQPQGLLKYSHPLTVDEVAVRHSKLKIVLCHLGNPWIWEAAEVVYKNPNVYADISGLFTKGSGYEQQYLDELSRRVREAIHYVGDCSKFLFGSDYPVESLDAAVDFAKSLGLDQRDYESVVEYNARKVFGL